MVLYLDPKWDFGTKSVIFEYRNFPNAYFSNRILQFLAGIGLSRPVDGGKKGRAYFSLLKKEKAYFDF